MKKELRNPGPLEMDILEVLWRQGPSTATTVRDALARTRDLAYSTVLTVLRRMEQKGMLLRKKISRSHEYKAKVDKSAFKQAFVKNLLSRFFSGSAEELMAHLVQAQNLSAKEISKIESLLRKQKGSPKK